MHAVPFTSQQNRQMAICTLCDKPHEAGKPHWIRREAMGLSEEAKARDAEVPNIRAMGVTKTVTKRRDKKNNVTGDTINVAPEQMEADIKGGRTNFTPRDKDVIQHGKVKVGRPKKHASHAERQRAYRERSK